MMDASPRFEAPKGKPTVSVLVSVESGPNGLVKILSILEKMTRLYNMRVVICHNASKVDFSSAWKPIQKHGWGYFQISPQKLSDPAYREWCFQKWTAQASTYNFHLHSGLELSQHFLACALKTWDDLPPDDLGSLNLLGETISGREILPQSVKTVEGSGTLDDCYMVSEQYLRAWPVVKKFNGFRVETSLVGKAAKMGRTKSSVVPKTIPPPPPPPPSSPPPQQLVKKRAAFFVATTHRPDLLRACLAQLQLQRVPPGWDYEILVGGEPTDAAKVIVRGMPRVRYIEVPTQTVTSKLNAMLQGCDPRTDLILLADDDDLQPVGRLEAAARAHDAGADWSGVGEVLFYALKEDRFMRWTGRADQGLVGTSLSFRGSLLRKIGGWPERARGKDGPMAAAFRKGMNTRPVFHDIGKDIDNIVCFQHQSNIWVRPVLEKGHRSRKGSFEIVGEGALDGIAIPEGMKKLLRELRGREPIPEVAAPVAVPVAPVTRKPRESYKRPATVALPSPPPPLPVAANPNPPNLHLIACMPSAPGQSAFADGLQVLGFQNVPSSKLEDFLSQGNPVLVHGWQKNYATLGRKYPGRLHVVWHSGYTGSDLMNEGRGLAPALQEARDGAYKLLWLERRDVLLPGMEYMTPVWDPASMRALSGVTPPEKIQNSVMACFHGEYPANAKNVFATLAACAKSGAELHLGDVVSKSRKESVDQILHGVKYQTYSFLKRHEAVQLAARMTLMVHPSVSDTWPYFVMETVYAGTPVIISDAISWGKDLSQWAQDMCVVRHHTSSREILAKIQTLLGNPKLIREIVQEQQRVLDKLAVKHQDEARERLISYGFPMVYIASPPLHSCGQHESTPSARVTDNFNPQLMEFQEMQRRTGPKDYKSLQREVDLLEKEVGGSKDRPVILIPSWHRFISRTLKIIRHLLPHYRFQVGTSHHDANLLWCLYPLEDSHAAMPFKKKTGIPFVQTLRGHFWHMPEHHKRIASNSITEADEVIVLSECLWRGVTDHFPEFKTKTVTVIPNGIEVEDANGELSDEIKAFPRPLILTVTNFNFKEKRQGVDEIVNALDAQGFQGTYLVAGLPGPYAPNKNFGQCGRFIGFSSQVPALHKNADLFLYHSYLDGQPTSIMEALSSGLPVVVGETPYNGAAQFVDHGKTGLIFKSADEGVALALNLLKDKKRMKALGQAARSHVVKTYTWEKTAEEYRKVFNRMLQQ